MSELVYSKKQLKPLIDKYVINPEKNTAFISVVTMFNGQPNYQFWGVKVIFSGAITLPELTTIKDWADKNQTLIKSLTKGGNLVSYTTKEDFALLKQEMRGLIMLSMANNIISMFNTAQRKILREEIMGEELNGLTCLSNKKFGNWYKLFEKFNKLSADTKTRVIKRASAMSDAGEIHTLLSDSIKNTYAWNKEDLIAYISNNTKNTHVVYDDDHIVVANVGSYSDSRALALKRTTWCITTSDSQWQNYVVSKNNNQYFLFDFSKNESDELAYIGFTVSDEYGLHAAHSKNDKDLFTSKINYNGQSVDIWKAFANTKLDMKHFLKFKKTKDFSFNRDSVCKYISSLPANFAVAFDKDNRMIINMLNSEAFDKLCAKRCLIRRDRLSINDSLKMYLLMDFNLAEDDEMSSVFLMYRKDSYGIETLERIFTAFGRDITKESYLNSIGITTDMYLNREDINPGIMLHKYIDEGNEAEAIALLDSDKDVDVNFEFNDRRPVFSAIEARMDKLIGKIIANEKFDTNLDDGFGENLVQALLYNYYLDDANKISEKKAKDVRIMIETVIDSGKFDMNFVDFSEDNVLNIACMSPSMLWLVEKLCKDKSTNVNQINDAKRAAVSTALFFDNLEALKIVGKRPDVVITKEDRAMAEKKGVKLDEYIKPEPFNEVSELEVKGEKKEAAPFNANVYEEIFKKVFSN